MSRSSSDSRSCCAGSRRRRGWRVALEAADRRGDIGAAIRSQAAWMRRYWLPAVSCRPGCARWRAWSLSVRQGIDVARPVALFRRSSREGDDDVGAPGRGRGPAGRRCRSRSAPAGDRGGGRGGDPPQRAVSASARVSVVAMTLMTYRKPRARRRPGRLYRGGATIRAACPGQPSWSASGSRCSTRAGRDDHPAQLVS